MTSQLFSVSSILPAPVASATRGPAACHPTVITCPLARRVTMKSRHASTQPKIDTDRDIPCQTTHSISIEYSARQKQETSTLWGCTSWSEPTAQVLPFSHQSQCRCRRFSLLLPQNWESFVPNGPPSEIHLFIHLLLLSKTSLLLLFRDVSAPTIGTFT